jgi:hypothetical protein
MQFLTNHRRTKGKKGRKGEKEQEGKQHLIAMLMAAACIRAVHGLAHLSLSLSLLPSLSLCLLSLYVIQRLTSL